MKAVTAKEMAYLDKQTIEQYSIDGKILMENAGSRSFEIIYAFVRNSKEKKRILIFVGTGNNGGDGLVIARYCASHQFDTSIVFFAENRDTFERRLTSETLAHYHILKHFSVQWFSIESFLKKEKNFFFPSSTIIVDAIFGTGLTRNVEGIFSKAISWINEQETDVFSIDIPSGISANNGSILGTAIKASQTITFAFPKIGHYQYPGKEYSGKLHVVEIGIPHFLLQKHVCIYSELNIPKIPHFFCQQSNIHKGKKGHVLIWAGSLDKPGAAHLSCRSAFRSSAGLVTLLTENVSTSPLILQKDHEVMLDIFESDSGFSHISDVFKKKTSMLIGPGLECNDQNVERLKNILSTITIPLVIDATGLDILKKVIDDNTAFFFDRKTQNIILTPHPGEMARLLETNIAHVQNDRVELAQAFAKKYHLIVVLKGAQTVIASKDNTAIIDIDEPALATAGSGDVLSGMISAICSKTNENEGAFNVFENVVFSVFLHAVSGKIARKHIYYQSVMANDIIEAIPLALNKYLRI